MHSVGGSFRHLYFYVVSRHPRQKRPWSHHYAFCVGSFRYPHFYGVSAAPPPEATLEPPFSILWGVLSRTLIQAYSYES